MVKKPDRDSTFMKLIVKFDYEFEIVVVASWSAGKHGKISDNVEGPIENED